MTDANKDKVLLDLHGGGFNSDSGSYTESIPIACYTKSRSLPSSTVWRRSLRSRPLSTTQ